MLGYRRQRFEARKVRRLVRHIDPWSMLKLAVLVSLCMWLISMIAAVILWTVARSSGTVGSLESFVNSSLQLQDWKLDGEFLFRQFGLISLLFHLGLSGVSAAVGGRLGPTALAWTDAVSGIGLIGFGTLLGITRERVRQIKEKALSRLRHVSRARSLESFLS